MFREDRLKKEMPHNRAGLRSDESGGEKDVYVWLKGTGRSKEELAQLIRESADNDARHRNHRRHDRHPLTDAHGDLIHQKSRIPCQVLEISLGGCSLQTEKPFHHGALAPVEVVLRILGMVLHIGGTTQWTREQRHIGVRFTHVSFNSEHQLASLIACLAGQKSPEWVKESVASPALNPAIGDVLAVQPPEAPEPPAEAPDEQPPYDPLVHCGESRLCAEREGEWPIVLSSPDHRFSLTGAIVDQSLGGCTVRTSKPFTGELHDPVEASFGMQYLHFLIGGAIQAIYDPQTVGIQFTSMNHRKREELELLVMGLCRARSARLDVA